LKLAVDAMGGDYAPKQIVMGAIEAVKKYDCEIVLVGDREKIEAEIKANNAQNLDRLTIHHTTEVIEMGEHPVEAVRKKKDSSLVVATKLVKTGECDGVLSAGSTGAATTAATLFLRTIKGVDKPSIATPLPTKDGLVLLLDSGAIVDSKPKDLTEMALMGSIYSQYVYGIDNPKVGLLNVGEEETKGNKKVQATYPMLKGMNSINFIGNVEGRDIPTGMADVVICDGFVGNIVLKFAEGLAVTLLDLIKDAIKNGGIFAKLGAVLVMPALKKLGKRLDVTEYGGAPLLGVNGCCIICHGSSDAKSICSAINVANEYVKNNVVDRIRDSIEKEEMLANDNDEEK
jgi:glycerol-3-phosphate acyltransferase PlsX